MKGLTLTKDGKLKLAEADVSKQLNDFLRFHGWHCIRKESEIVTRLNGKVRPVGTVGEPDWICTRPWGGKPGIVQFFYREDKSLRGKPSIAQLAYHERLRRDGFLVCVPHSYEEFIEWYGEYF